MKKLIAEVEAETGLPRATLRIWERRYGFPAPARDERGERVYTAEQVRRLCSMRRLLEQGHRPAGLMAMGTLELERLCRTAPEPAMAQAPAALPDGEALLRCLRQHDSAGVQGLLRARLSRRGLAGFVAEIAVLNAAVGQWWRSGQLQIHQEHVYTDCLQSVLRQAIMQLKVPVRAEAPRVLLATLPNELHALGLLMAQAMLALQGCHVVQLGVRVPPQQVADACVATRADLVGLTFAAHHSPLQLARDLGELRVLLAPHVRIWVGGSGGAAARLRLPGVRAVPDITQVPDLLAEEFALAPA